MTNKAKRKQHEIASAFDEEQEKANAHDKRRKEFEDGLKRVAGYMPKDTSSIDFAKSFLINRISELDEGKLSSLELIGWDSILFICTFDMEYDYTSVVDNGDDEESGEPLKIISRDTGWLEEYHGQQELIQLLNCYFTAAAALAKRIDSKTYQGWVDLLIEFTYEVKGKHDNLRKRLDALNRQLWAENEVYERNLQIQQKHPPLYKKRG